MWQWFRFLLRQVPPGRPVLRLNLDETSIRFWYEPRLGLRRPAGQVPSVGCARQASRGQLRKAFSHVAIICDDASLQPHLPQVLLVNERTVTAEQHRRWTSLPGCNAKLWRGKSAWINDKVFASIIRTLGKVLRERAGDRQAILLLDAHVCHFSLPTLAACREYDIWPVIIPARMTSMLQPLDTHVFSRFKMFLRTRLHQLMLSGANEDLTSEQVVDALLHAMKGVLQRHSWAPAFAKNGFGPEFEVRAHLLEMLAWRAAPVIECFCQHMNNSCIVSPYAGISPSCNCSPVSCRLHIVGRNERGKKSLTLLQKRARCDRGGRDCALVFVAAFAMPKQSLCLQPWLRQLLSRL